MKIGQLAERTGEAVRNIRFLISEGVVPHPAGTRADPEYGDTHVAAVARYQALKQDGHRLAVIKVLMQQDVAAAGAVAADATETVTVEIAPGLSLQIVPSLVNGSINPSELADRLVEALAPYTKERHHARRRRSAKR